jgi:hypothetical protein
MAEYVDKQEVVAVFKRLRSKLENKVMDFRISCSHCHYRPVLTAKPKIQHGHLLHMEFLSVLIALLTTETWVCTKVLSGEYMSHFLSRQNCHSI